MWVKSDIGNDIFKNKFKIVDVSIAGGKALLKCNKCGKVHRVKLSQTNKPKCCEKSFINRIVSLFKV